MYGNMKKLILQWLEKIACHHEWGIHSEIQAEDKSKGTIVLIRQTLICKKCGKIKQITL